MASGDTTTLELQDSLPSIVASARIVREYEGNMQRLAENITLGEGTGLSWREVSFAQLNGQDITETTYLDNPQQLSDSMFTVTPSVSAIHTVITDRVKARISKNALAKVGSLAQNAIERKKDEDGLAILDAASETVAGGNAALTAGHIGAAGARVRYGHGIEPTSSPVRAVLHAYQIKDIYSEIINYGPTAAWTTSPFAVTLGDFQARVYQEGFMGKINGVEIFENNNISIDSDLDAHGGVFAQEGVVLVQGRSPRVVTLRNEKLGGGADELIIYDEYAYGERSAGAWIVDVTSDATEPTT